MKRLLLAASAAVMLTACAPNVRTDSYSIGSVGQVNRTVSGTVISVRAVSIDGSQGGGAVAGAAAGGVAGSTIGGSDQAAAIGAIGGLVVGAIAGAASERTFAGQGPGIRGADGERQSDDSCTRPRSGIQHRHAGAGAVWVTLADHCRSTPAEVGPVNAAMPLSWGIALQRCDFNPSAPRDSREPALRYPAGAA